MWEAGRDNESCLHPQKKKNKNNFYEWVTFYDEEIRLFKTEVVACRLIV